MIGLKSYAQRVHLLAFAEILEGAGRTIDERYYRDRIAGRPNDRVIAEAFPGASERERQVLAASKEALYRASLTNIRPVTGVANILQWAKDARIRCAVVTTSPRASVEAVLQSTDLDGFLTFSQLRTRLLGASRTRFHTGRPAASRN